MTQVSILIAAYNAEATLGAAIESALAQTNITCEIIVIDDCSTDDTHKLALGYARQHANVCVLQTPENSGPSAARNIGIEAARGEWIAVLDADDTMEPERLCRMISFASCENSDLVFDNMIVRERAEQKLFLDRNMPSGFDMVFFATHNLSYISRPALGYLKPVISRAFLMERGLRYESALSNSEDYLLVMEVLAHGGNVGYMSRAGYHYYIHDASISAKFKSKQNADFIAAENVFLERYKDSLSSAQKNAIRRHIHFRVISEPVFYCIEAIKERRLKDFLTALNPYSWKERFSVFLVLTLVIFRKIFFAKSRF